MVDVVTSRSPTLFMPLDPSLKKLASIIGQQIEIPIFESRYVNYILRKFMPFSLSRPDSKMTFHWQSSKVVRKLKQIPDIIYSRSFPLSSAILAFKLSKQFSRPWVMHLSDPWTENALHSYSAKEKKYHDEMEMKCIEHAVITSFTSEKTLKLYRNKYPQWEHKFMVFPNVYDPDALAPRRGSADAVSGTTKIVYTGGLANTRSAYSLLEALKIVEQRSPLLSSRLEVIFAGDMDRNNRELFANCHLPFVRHMGQLTANQAKGLQDKADLLVVIDSKIDDPDRAVFFPSKLLDYGILGKPILAITDKGSVTDEFVLSHGGVSFQHLCIHEMADWLASFIEGDQQVELQTIESWYAADQQAGRLIEVLKKNML